MLALQCNICDKRIAYIPNQNSFYQPNSPSSTESGALPLLVALLKDGSAAEKEHAAGTMWHLAHDSGIKIALRELGKAPTFPVFFCSFREFVFDCV
jgi:hypothetical protein